MNCVLRLIAASAFVLGLASAPALAQIKIGVVISMTGAAATLGLPQKNAVELMPKSIGGKSVEYIVLDDASDPTNARKLVERLVTEDKVDLLMGPSISPSSLAVIEVAARSKTPLISFAAARAIIQPMDDTRRWIYKTVINDDIFARVTAEHMKKSGIKRVAVIGFNDAYGESWSTAFNEGAKAAKLEIVAAEKFNRNDTSVTAQILKIVSAKPDAVLIIASGTPGVLPQATLNERGFKGKIYQTTGVTTNDFIRVGGKNVERTIIASGPLIVAHQLPDSNRAKKAAVEFADAYNAAYGANSISAFPGFAWDGILIAQAGLTAALTKAQPGTAEFRQALNDAIENGKDIVTTSGLVTMRPQDHSGFIPDSLVLIEVKNGKWTYLSN